MTKDEDKDKQAGRKGDALQQLASVAIPGSSIRTEPGTDPDNINDDEA